MSGHSSHSVRLQQNPLTLEVVPEDPQDIDLALIDAVGRDVTEALRNSGYEVEPIYTGQRGGFLIEVFPQLANFATNIWAQKDIILTDMSALVTILTSIIPIVTHLREAHKKRSAKNNPQQSSIKILIEIDRASLTVEAPDIESAETVIDLARRFQANHPAIAAKITSQSKAKVTGIIPKSQRRKRR